MAEDLIRTYFKEKIEEMNNRTVAEWQRLRINDENRYYELLRAAHDFIMGDLSAGRIIMAHAEMWGMGEDDDDRD